MQKYLKCKLDACNDDDKVLYLFNKHGMLQASMEMALGALPRPDRVPE
jgi:hypothetical protein